MFLPLNMRVSWKCPFVSRIPYCPSLPAMPVAECKGMSFPLTNQHVEWSHVDIHGTFAKRILEVQNIMICVLIVPKLKIHHCSFTCAIWTPWQLQSFRTYRTEDSFFLHHIPHHQYRISYWWNQYIPYATENLLAKFQVSKRAVWRNGICGGTSKSDPAEPASA